MVDKTQFNNVVSLFIVASIFALQVAAQTVANADPEDLGDIKATSARSSRRRRLAGGAIAGIVIGLRILRPVALRV